MADPDPRDPAPASSGASGTSPRRSDARLVLIRHGQTEWAASGRHTGRTDIALTADGEDQARAAGDRIAALGLERPLVVSSPRSRALRTAELAGLTVDRVWDALVEWDYGDYEGLTTPQIRETAPHWTVWTHPSPSGETIDAVSARADLVLSVVVPTLAERDVVLVGHGHFSRSVIARWVEQPVTEGKRFALAPAGFTVLGYEHEYRQIHTHNVDPRLGS
ncbi:MULTISPECIES: acid phosphatase [Nocardiaceae]|uniref:Phosphoglycerate mutase n=1 Tax=Rhodococcoides corynebacterioides TaxID=53972 RepID=A0ABS2KQR4_9NOCA|nr:MULTISPECIES: acid phosphatase [Rhodococcus]MBM7414314.1 putative phosphoglycerate mutase [Rhodococcus corynebacterioides]MBP1116777.1 putative phosphoglycerate mutase [Rhodococcus sp. PvP016]